VSPSYTLGLRFPLLRSEVGPGAGGTAPEWDHVLIGLHHTGRADTTRFKRDANLPRGETWADSTCHDGLLAAVKGAAPGGRPSAVGLPETRPHSRVVVVRVEYSSRTLAPCLPLCRKCSHSSLWRSVFCWPQYGPVYHPRFEPLLDRSSEVGAGVHLFQEGRLLAAVKAAGDIGIEHVSGLYLYCFPYLLHRIVA
jgi:hypothetical protein